jgi:hypothetical protein
VAFVSTIAGLILGRRVAPLSVNIELLRPYETEGHYLAPADLKKLKSPLLASKNLI